MKLQSECIACLGRIIDYISENVGRDCCEKRELERLKRTVLEKGLRPDKCPPWLTTQILEAACAVTGEIDPYRSVRHEEMAVAEKIFGLIGPLYGNDFRSCVELAVLGNNLDFDRDTGDLESAVVRQGGRRLSFSIDHIDRAEAAMNSLRGGVVLFLADNAGEAFFDLPLIENITDMGMKPIYGVKEKPFINDLTLADLERVGMLSRIPEVLSTGGGAILDLPSLSPAFRKELESCDLIISKGQANYECLSELLINKRVLYLLKAKCQLISRTLGVPLDTYVALLTEPHFKRSSMRLDGG